MSEAEDPAPDVRITPAEVMCVAIARRLREAGTRTAFQGFSSPLPTAAIRLAREGGGDLVHLSASGAVNGRPAALPASTEDAHLLEGATGTFTSPEAFDLAARGDLDVMFVGGPQIDRRGRMNATAIGPRSNPRIRFPGGGGSGSLLSLVNEAWAWRTEHSPRTLPASVDFVTASGNLASLVTPLCVFERVDGELVVSALHPGVGRETVRERTGWDVRFDDPGRTGPPTETELECLDRVDPNRVRRAGFAAEDLRPAGGGVDDG